MKTEEFDDAIRGKLESINQTFTESDIDKVYHHAVSKQKSFWKGLNGSWLVVSLSAAAFTVVTFWAVSQFKSNDNSLKNQKPVVSTTIRATTDSTKKTDSIENKQARKIGLSRDSISKILSEASKGDKTIGNSTVITQNSPAIPPATVANQVIQMESNTNQIEKSTQESQNLQQTAPSEHQENKIEPIIPILNALSKIHFDSLTARLKRNKTSQDEPQQSRKETSPESTNSNPSLNLNLVDVKDTTIRRRLLINIFNGTSFQLSIGSRITSQKLGMGLTAGLFFINKISIESGLRICFLPTENFKDKGELFGHKPHDFNHGIEDHIHDRNNISDLSLSSRLIQIPVYLNYYLPLKRNYLISMKLGTDLDVNISQKLSYNEPHGGMKQPNTFRSNGEIIMWNNLFLAFGIEKRWKSVILQMQPSISPQIISVFYKPKGLEFGFDAGLKYCFGK